MPTASAAYRPRRHSLSLGRRRLLAVVSLLWMGLFSNIFASPSSKQQGSPASSPSSVVVSAIELPIPVMSNSLAGSATAKELVQQRLRIALWSFFAGDALASPTHWFYGGSRQVRQYYNGIMDYTKPVYNLPGSILNKSDPYGGGRRQGRDNKSQKPIIGSVINHGKLDLWHPSQSIHYHATLQKGEPTLEAQLARVLMKSMVACQGRFDLDHFQQQYVDYMTTPGSHNDTYASTCHRMFFANRVYRGKPLKECPDNDGHNVDTIDGLILPSIVALAQAGKMASSSTASIDKEEMNRDLALCVRATRKSPILEQVAGDWGQLVRQLVLSDTDVSSDSDISQTLMSVARDAGVRKPKIQPRGREEVTACYLGSAFPALLDSVMTHTVGTDGSTEIGPFAKIWNALLVNANTGGENVHKGSCLGAVVGAYHASKAQKSNRQEQDQKVLQHMMQGLHEHAALNQEIEEFVQVVTNMQSSNQESQTNEL